MNAGATCPVCHRPAVVETLTDEGPQTVALQHIACVHELQDEVELRGRRDGGPAPLDTVVPELRRRADLRTFGLEDVVRSAYVRHGYLLALEDLERAIAGTVDGDGA